MTASVRVAPSILSADFTRLGEQIAAAEKAGADQLHVDVMDGHFVPNISIGPVVVESIRRATRLPLDTHLMISEPDRYLEAFAMAGADALTVHIELDSDTSPTLRRIRELGLRAGIAISPETPIERLSSVAGLVDIILIMSVHPGFGGQSFIEESVNRIGQARRMLDQIGSRADLAVDGGIGPDTAGKVMQAGATVLVAGNAIFRASTDIASAIRALRQAAKAPQA